VNRELVRKTLLENYEVKVNPLQENGEPTKVGVGMTVNYFTIVRKVFFFNKLFTAIFHGIQNIFSEMMTGDYDHPIFQHLI